MLLGQVFQSVGAWRKLSAVNMKPSVAYKILKYTKAVNAEFDIAEKQRVLLIHDITETEDGQDASIEPNSEEFAEYATRLSAVMSQESDLGQCELDFGVVVDALDGKDDVLSVSDLAQLEPFFQTGDNGEGE